MAQEFPESVAVTGSREKRPTKQIPFYFSTSDTDIYESVQAHDDDLNLREYLRKVLRHKLLVALVTIMLTAAAAYYLYTQPNNFQAEAQIQVDSENNGSLQQAAKNVSPFDDRAYYNTQLELLENPTLLGKVVKQLDLENNHEFLTDDIKADLESRQQAQAAAGSPIKINNQAKAAEPESFSGNPEAERLSPMVEVLTDYLSINPVLESKQSVKDTRLISVRFKHLNPKIAALVTNSVVRQLVESNLQKKNLTTEGESTILENNIAELKQQIRSDEEKLLQYGRNYQLPTADDKQNTVVERLSGLNTQLLEAENERKLAEAAYRAALAPGAADAFAESNTKQLSDVDGKLDDLRQRRAQLLVEVTEKYPEVREIDKQIAVLENSSKDKRDRAAVNYKTTLEMRYRQTLAREEAIRKSYKEQWDQTLNQNGAAINYRIIQQGLETNRKLLDQMQQRQKETELYKAKIPNNIQVVNYAVTPTEPMNQKRGQLLGLAFFASFAVGIGAALLRDYFDDSIYSPVEVEKALSLPALASIPAVRPGIFGHHRRRFLPAASLSLTNSAEPRAFTMEAGDGLIINSDAHSPLTESFRQLRTMLQLSPEVGQIKKLLVTSSCQGEGKTTTAVNIAVSLAQTGAAVLLIDADLRRPRLHKIFNISNDFGLCDLLLTRDAETDKIYSSLFKQSENLYFLTSGNASAEAADCLSSKQMQELLLRLETVFDYIIIDSPPVGIFADSAILASLTDGVLLVVQENRNSSDTLRQTKKLLNLVGANLVGIVLNKVSGSPENYGYRYHE